MPPLKYHQGQIAAQREANTTMIAETLSRWVGPVDEFTALADIILFATTAPNGTLQFTVLSGKAPLVQFSGGQTLRLRLPTQVSTLPADAKCGGLSINLAQARRARVNGQLTRRDGNLELVAEETFTLCRKYMAPSLSLHQELVVGPANREPVNLNEQWLADVLAKAETTFLASVSPTGMPDVAHRGGPPGFVKLDSALGKLTWTEYLGDGVFKSAGNVRATGVMTLLVPDMATGDAVELVGRATYENIRTSRRQRLDPLIQDKEPHPVQGVIKCEVAQAFLLKKTLNPRQPVNAEAITSCDVPDDQAPQ